VLALPLAPDRLGPPLLAALREAVGRQTGAGGASMEAAVSGRRAFVYCEHADGGGLRKALEKMPAEEAARAAQNPGLSEPPPEIAATAAMEVVAGEESEEVLALREALDRELRAAEVARSSCDSCPRADSEKLAAGPREGPSVASAPKATPDGVDARGPPAAATTTTTAAAGAAATQSLRDRKQLADAELRVRRAAADLAAARFAAQTAAWAEAGVLRRQGRARQGGIDAFMARGDVRGPVVAAGLQREEVAGLRLYTGPLYVLYNRTTTRSCGSSRPTSCAGLPATGEAGH
jgi:hypothetical protein